MQKSPPPTCAAAPARACSSACRTCRKPAQLPGAARDALLLRVIGSPDPYGKQIDGMGGATSSTSKAVILSRSSKRRPRRRLPVRPGRDRQGLRRLERQLRQPVGGGRLVRHQRRPGRPGAHPAGRHGHRAHLAGQHRQDHHRPRADDGRRGAGDRRLRARWRDLPGGRSAARIHGPGGRRRGRGRLDVPDRAAWSTTWRCRASAPSRRP